MKEATGWSVSSSGLALCPISELRPLRVRSCLRWEGPFLWCVQAASCSRMDGVSVLSCCAVWAGRSALSSLSPPRAEACRGRYGFFRLVLRCVGWCGRGLCPGSVRLVVAVDARAGGRSGWVGVRFSHFWLVCCASRCSCARLGQAGWGAAGVPLWGSGCPPLDTLWHSAGLTFL